LYSPSNQRYPLEGLQSHATLRPEFAGSFGGNSAGDKGVILQQGDSYRADMFVAVWTSLLLASDWWSSGPAPLGVILLPGDDGLRVTVTNRTPRQFPYAKLAHGDRIYDLGEIGPREAKSFSLGEQSSQLLTDFAGMHGGRFQEAVQSRQYAFRGGSSGRIDDLPNASAVLSFISALSQASNPYGRFTVPPGLDLSPALRDGAAILLAWDSNYVPGQSMARFSPKTTRRNTLWRVLARP
jgi:hypothetical protein